LNSPGLQPNIISIICKKYKVRIISGKYGGRILTPPKRFKARPTTDKAKESLFNILGNMLDFEDLRVLDLFAGTGAIGLEFISRGAKEAVFIEKNFQHFNFIRQNLETLGIRNARAFKADAFRALQKLETGFDIVFADPPYALETLDSIPSAVISTEVLLPGGWLILEHSGDYDFANEPGFHSLRKYGSVHFSFFRPVNEGAQT